MSKCLWITGLSASGKTTLSKLLVEQMRLEGEKVLLLDGDELRHILADEAYTREDRIALSMKYSKLCKLLTDQGINVVIAVIGLFHEIHEWNRVNIYNYTEVFINTPISELKKRDPKGVYKKYASGEIINVAGMDLEVDFPKSPEILLQWHEGRLVKSMFDELLVKYKELN
mgnify:CR=1 FL=1